MNQEFFQIKNDGMFFDVGTDASLAGVLETVREKKIRIKLDLGDPKTGKSWNETWGVTGYVGRTTGRIKSPILVFNKRAMGGGLILTKNVLAVYTSAGHKLIWENPKAKVLRAFPGAQAFLEEDPSYGSKTWVVWDDTVEQGLNPPLGFGLTAEMAWNNASTNSRVKERLSAQPVHA